MTQKGTIQHFQESGSLTSIDELLFEVALEEFRTLKAEQSSFIHIQNQLVLYALVSAGGVIPIVISLLGSDSQELLLALLLVFPLVFEAMALAYLGHQRWVQIIGEYILVRLSPLLSIYQGSFAAKGVKYVPFEYEQFIRSNARSSLVEGIVMMFTNLGDIFLLLLPSVFSLAAIYYISSIAQHVWLKWQKGLLFIDVFFLILIILAGIYLLLRSLRHGLSNIHAQGR